MDIDQIFEEIELPFELSSKQKEIIIENDYFNRLLLATDVGTGKTVISTLLMLCKNVAHIVVICPPILQLSWSRWLTRIGEKDNSIYAGQFRKESQLSSRWLIVSHAIFRNDHEIIERYYSDKDFGVIFDEAHALKNHNSSLFKKTKSFVRSDCPVILLTATPTTKPEDTFSYMQIKTPNLYRSFGHWQNLHVGTKDEMGRIVSYDNIELLASNFALNTIKLTKEDIFDRMPTPILNPIEYELSKKHMDLYRKLAEEQLLALPNGEKIDAATAQRLRHALQQVIVNFEKFSGHIADKSASYDLLDELLEQVEPQNKNNSKLVVWTWYKHTSASVTKYLKNIFGENNVVAAYGDVDSQKAVDEIMFGKARIMVAQPTSVGAGLDLQHVCNQMLFLELSTTPLHVKQAIGRVDRPGQKITPTIHFGLAAGTIQMRLYRDLLNNDDLIAKVELSKSSLRRMIYGN